LKLKFIGLDSISISCPASSVEGRKAHQALLGEHESGKPPILIIEDMALQGLNDVPYKIIVAPLIFECADGAPVTVLAMVQ